MASSDHRTDVKAYKLHQYSGKRKNQKCVQAQLKRYHGEDITNREQLWRKKTKKEPTHEDLNNESREATPKQYSRTPKYRKEATFTQVQEPQTTPPNDIPIPNCSKDINWPNPDPTISSVELIVETSIDDSMAGLTGNRIVNMKHVLQWAFKLERHRRKCECSTIEFVEEHNTGFKSTFIFKCSMCGEVFRENNDPDDQLNKGFVWGTVTGGGYYSQTAHLTNVLDIPTISPKTFKKIEDSLGDIWNDQLTEEIKKVGQQERQIAIENGQVNSDGIPFIEVIVDGGWAKRSYGHDYNSASGMACIMGKNTKQCLFIGIKNKYCYHCSIYENKNKPIPEHKCFKNYKGTSTGMESEILVEGFKKSMEMHGLQYLTFIGDGDSSVFAMLKEQVSYGPLIKKVECKNHVMKNYTSKLYKILANTKLPNYGRRLLKQRLNKLVITSKKIIINNENDKGKMRKDLHNGPLHCFGKHTECEAYYCKFNGNPDLEKDSDCVEQMKKENAAVWALITAANEAVISKANRLSNDTTNIVENFMSIISKYNCGKRIALHKGGSYQRRVQIAGLSQISGTAWHSPAWRKCTTRSPGKTFKKYMARIQKSKERQKTYTRRRIFPQKPAHQTDKSYGPDAQETVDPVDLGELRQRCIMKLVEFQKTPEEIASIEEATIGQHDNDLYVVHRAERLTASQFGLICKRRDSTPCNNHVKSVLYQTNASSRDMLYGQNNESVARTLFAENMTKQVRQAGLYIDEEFGFLGASPDGVVLNENAILEIKCFPSLLRINMDIQTAAKEKKDFPVRENADGTLAMNKKHTYYYQVQGQLRITKMQKCYFICFISASTPLTIIEVERDNEFIQTMMPKLVKFYKNCILPEIILKRIPKGALCVEYAME